MKNIMAVIAGLALLFAPAAASAAEEENQTPNTDLVVVKNDRGGALYLILGNRTMEINGLNSALSSAGHQPFDRNFISMGMGGHAILGDLVLGLEGHGLSRKQGSTAAWRTTASAWYFLANAGWVVKRAPGYILYPQAGVGFGAFNLFIDATSPATFGQTLANPAQGTSLSKNSWVFNLALAADGFHPLGSTSGGKEIPFIFGFRAGYLFSSGMGEWRTNGGDIAGGPDAPFNGPYLEIVIGLGLLG